MGPILPFFHPIFNDTKYHHFGPLIYCGWLRNPVPPTTLYKWLKAYEQNVGKLHSHEAQKRWFISMGKPHRSIAG